ncbi:DUF2514 domain-containing protein [Pseudomonas caspiana]
MTSLYARAAAVLAVIALVFGILYAAYSHGVTVTDSKWKAVWADQALLQAKGAAAATTTNRTEEQRRQTAANQVGTDAREQIKTTADAGAAADAAGDRVRSEAGSLAARASCTGSDPGVTERGKAATRAAMVLSDMFQRADKRAGELAKAYDGARIAGLACEAAFDSLLGKPGN